MGGTLVIPGVEGRGVVFDPFEPFPKCLPFAGISCILFETRLGCLQEEIPKDILRFINAVNDMLQLSETVILFPRWSRGILPFWKRFVQAWDDLCDVGMQQKKQQKETIPSLDSQDSKLFGFCVFVW